MIHVQIADDIAETIAPTSEDHSAISPELLEKAARQTVEYVRSEAGSITGEEEVDLTLVLTNDKEIHGLNLQYRNVDAPTDVLSFPLNELDADSGNLYLGDVIISLDRATAQAQAKGHFLADELCFLVVHGVLHLLGYDHADETEMATMWSAQSEILGGLGLHAQTGG